MYVSQSYTGSNTQLTSGIINVDDIKITNMVVVVQGEMVPTLITSI